MGELTKIAAKKSNAKSEILASRTRQIELSQSLNSPVDQILFLQRTIGNQAVQRLMKSGAIQAKLRIGASGDVYEQEADRVAEQVMRMTEPAIGIARATAPQIQRQCSGCQDELKRQPLEDKEEEGKKMLQTKGGKESEISASVQTGLKQTLGSGSALPPSAQSDMEEYFGIDFSDVRVHTDSSAQEMNLDLNARAFTSGNDIYFNAGEYHPETPEGKHLLAHELTHVVQQTSQSQLRKLPSSSVDKISYASEPRIARNTNRPQGGRSIFVSYVSVYLGTESFIDFHTSEGLFRYRLDQEGLEAGEYQASVVVRGNNVNFTLDARAGQGRFTYRIGANQPNPSRFFSSQSSVVFSITREPAPSIEADAQPDDRDPSVTYLTLEEAMRRCQTGDLPGVKIFPYRGTRFGAAPLMAHRDGNDIIVKQPVYVRTNSDFQEQTRTLPLETFIGGVRLRANEIVRVHTYEPRWYHLNITGSTSGDLENEFCVTGAQMLQLAEQSTRRTFFNIGLTVLDAALFFVPVGKLLQPVTQFAGRWARNVAISAMLGLRDAGPTVFAGIASRAPIVLVEEQAVDQVASRAVSQTLSHATIEFSEHALAQTTARATGEIAAQTGTREAIARTVTVTVVDATGHQAVSAITTPTGDAALDAMIDQAFASTFNAPGSPAASQAAQQGVTTVAPEIAAGFTATQVQGFRRFLAKPLSHQDVQVLGQLWNNAARPGDNAILSAANSRHLFDLHRNRFWTLVRNNPTARAIFTDAGCQFSGGAPYYMLGNRRITMTIDHIIERQTAPQLALTASNLRMAFSRENSVVLRLLNQLDPFQ